MGARVWEIFTKSKKKRQEKCGLPAAMFGHCVFLWSDPPQLLVTPKEVKMVIPKKAKRMNIRTWAF